MKSISFLVISLLVFLSLSCQKENSVQSAALSSSHSKILFSFSVKDAPADVAKIVGILSRNNFDALTCQFTISEDTAHCSFNHVAVGVWHLQVNAYDAQNTLKYFGGTDVEVFPGFTTPVFLRLDPATGAIDITVTWGSEQSGRGLIAYYPFNGNANDESGNGHNGIVHNARFVNGIKGIGVSFNDDQYIEISLDSAATLEPSYYTVEAWVKPITIAPGSLSSVIMKSNGGCGCGWMYGFDINENGIVDVEFCLPNRNFFNLLSPEGLTVENWTFITSTYDGKTLSLYFNGELVTSAVLSMGPMDYSDWGGGPLYMGKKYDRCYPDNYIGLLDEVRIYSRALSAAEIKEHYDQIVK
jgi:hypothetical protein